MKNGSNPMLHGPEILRIDPPRPQTLEVLEGVAYVTTEGDAEDHFVAAGNRLVVPGHHVTLVQGWPEAQVCLC